MNFGNIMAYKWSALAVIALSLGGCAASGMPYTDLSQSPISNSAFGRLTIFRTTETMAAAGRDANIKVDSATTKYVSYGGYVSFDLSAGAHEINASMPGDETLCTVQVSLAPRDELFFEVKPASGRILGEAISAGFAVAGSMAGQYGGGVTFATTDKPCTGYFSIAPVERAYALKQLATIRESSQ